MKIHPEDAAAYNVENGEWVRIVSKAGKVKIKTLLTDEVPRGLLTMPHGYGFTYPEHQEETTGALVNILTSTEACDPLAKTPYHKNVSVRLEKIEA